MTAPSWGPKGSLKSVLDKTRFWERFGDLPLSARQRLVLNRMLDGFEGKLTTAKWATLAKCSHDTALRDIQELVERGLLVRSAEGGRSTGYELVKLP